MRKLYAFIVVLGIALLTAMPNKISAQSTTDTVYIPGSQSLQISNIINADTSVAAKRVYVLDRGAIYYIEKAFEITHSATFIAKGDASKRPPVLAPAIRADNSSEEWFFKFIKPGIKIELNDLYLLSMRSDGKTLGWSRALHIGSNNISVKLRRVVFDAFTEAGIRVDGAKFVKLDVQDSHFRNFIHSTSYFGGQPFLTGGLDHPDSTVFINNTFFACNSYLFSVRGYDPYSVFEHNTVIYGAVNPFLIRQASNLYLKNNLFYASHAWGGDPEQVIGGWFFNYPDTAASSIYMIRKKGTYHGISMTGPEAFVDDANGITSAMFDPSKRLNITVNNAYHFPEKLVKYYNDWNDTVTVADSVELLSGKKVSLTRKLTLARWIYDLGIEVLDSLTNPSSWDYSPLISVANNVDANPGFTDAGVVGHVDELIGYVNRIASRKLDTPWHYQLNFPPKWPIPENLAYSNTTLQSAGDDGFAVGDLNWFPAQKAQWITDVDETEQVSAVPTEYTLSQNYPNPFNPSTKITFSLPQRQNVSVKVYNVIGQLVATLANKEFEAGTHVVNFNASNLSSGIYFYTMNAGDYTITKKMMLVK